MLDREEEGYMNNWINHHTYYIPDFADPDLLLDLAEPERLRADPDRLRADPDLDPDLDLLPDFDLDPDLDRLLDFAEPLLDPKPEIQ